MNSKNHLAYRNQEHGNPPRPTNELTFDWLNNIEQWDKDKFSNDIAAFIEKTQGTNTYPNMILIGMLSHQIEVYCECYRQMEQHGLVADYNRGVTVGPSLYFSMADKALNRVLQIMKELGLTPRHLIGVVRKTDSEGVY